MAGPEEWFKSLTPVAKVWLSIAVITTFGAQFGFINLAYLYFDPLLIYSKFQVISSLSVSWHDAVKSTTNILALCVMWLILRFGGWSRPFSISANWDFRGWFKCLFWRNTLKCSKQVRLHILLIFMMEKWLSFLSKFLMEIHCFSMPFMRIKIIGFPFKIQWLKSIDFWYSQSISRAVLDWRRWCFCWCSAASDWLHLTGSCSADRFPFWARGCRSLCSMSGAANPRSLMSLFGDSSLRPGIYRLCCWYSRSSWDRTRCWISLVFWWVTRTTLSWTLCPECTGRTWWNALNSSIGYLIRLRRGGMTGEEALRTDSLRWQISTRDASFKSSIPP